MIERIKIVKPFFSAPAGATLKLLPDSRMMEVCDSCGEKRYCDYYEWDPSIRGMTGMDICRTCAKKLEVKE